MGSIAHNLLLWFYNLIVTARYLADTVAVLLLVAAPLCPQTVETGDQRGNAVVAASIDFDDHQPQNTTERAGAELSIVSRAPEFEPDPVPLETWTECVLDHSTLVHVWA